MNRTVFTIFLFLPLFLLAQKKPLDHTVYDGWQSIGERMISNDGRWVVYTITPQEGDADLYIQSVSGTYKKQVPRGYNAAITEDNRFVVFKIKPFYKDTREARIKKKKPEEMPKDSIGFVELGKDAVVKVAKIRSYKMPEKGGGWLAFQKEKDPATARGAASSTQKTVDSLKKIVDSLRQLVVQIKNEKAGAGADSNLDAEEEPGGTAGAAEGTDLVLRNLVQGREKTFKNVVDYSFNKYGQKLVMRVSKSAKDSPGVNAVLVYDLQQNRLDTILKGGNDFRSFALSGDGKKIAFLADRDTNTKALQKFYGLYYYRSGDDSATLLVDKNSESMKLGTTVSENGAVSFSKSGNRLLFGTVALPVPRDTSLIDIDLVKLDIWNYKDDYLQTQQLFQMNTESKRSYQALYDFSLRKVVQMGSKDLPTIIPTAEGDGEYFLAITDTGRRVQSQWMGNTLKDVYSINVRTGERALVKRNHDGQIYPSSTGKYILLYDNKLKQYFAWNGNGLRNITAQIKVPLYSEENDTPDDPNPYGVMGWHQNDAFVYLYDRYDVWKVDPAGKIAPVNITVEGRKTANQFRYVKLDPEERYFSSTQSLFFKVQNQKTRTNGFVLGTIEPTKLNLQWLERNGPNNYVLLAKAENNNNIVVSKENYMSSPDLYVYAADKQVKDAKDVVAERLTFLNPQQAQYNWGTAELYRWKAFDGKPATGILYKPENFDSTKKYPMLIYFYEKLSDGLYNYIAPAPTPSRLNIPFFVSRGYLVFAPDISYTKGHPGRDAYNYIVSGAQALSKKKWVDGKNIGIQGQSWGGYQVAYLVTATNMFKAAWAGAPVVNMFSAYGGIRWESGNNRQFQYEKGQSRIGYTPWERPDLYMENSPFFHLKKVTTPLVIMSNDADGAVPWYQGIEFFTAMRRLNKKVWLLNYNGEAHNLVERKNRKDIQIREQQYFDWLLKGEKPAKWITEGVPAVKKGKDWGLELVDEVNNSASNL